MVTSQMLCRIKNQARFRESCEKCGLGIRSISCRPGRYRLHEFAKNNVPLEAKYSVFSSIERKLATYWRDNLIVSLC